MLVLAQYGEIGTKGKNRPGFERLLLSNIKETMKGMLKSAKVRDSRIFLEVEGDAGEARSRLMKVFGIEWFAFARECGKGVDEIWEAVAGENLAGKGIAVETKRVDKSFPMKSQELSAEIGARIVKKF
ncbi:MAG TPA: THUMP domain-containing protein, partial [Candidatus Bilamarchaeaceae archaeon]|nr:THUMP domain-containing protein [Candidatus Bilamarchaeaceae archaeon]